MISVDEMTKVISFTRADTFECGGVYKVNGVPSPLDGITVTSQIDREDGTAVSDLLITKAADQILEPGVYYGIVADTSAWPVQRLLWDIKFAMDGKFVRTEQVFIRVQRNATP